MNARPQFADPDPLLALADKLDRLNDEHSRCLLRIIDLRLAAALSERTTLKGLQESVNLTRLFIHSVMSAE